MTFNLAASAYDAFMGRYSNLLVGQMADFANIRPGDRAIDVGCGPGALTAELVRRLGADRVAVRSRVPPPPFTIHASAWAARGRVTPRRATSIP